MKICSRCKEEKKLDQFCKKKDGKDGLSYYCKICRSEKNNIEYQNTKEEKNKYYIQNKQERLKYQTIYISNNKSKINLYTKLWHSKNREYLNKYVKKYIKNKCETDPLFKLTRNIRSRISIGLKTNSKSSKTENLIGCKFEELKTHLENQFKPEMNWDNHGKIWEIDHIKPIFMFDLSNINQQKQCFHYTNTQPLFKTTEIAKSYGYTNEIGNRNKTREIITNG